jgi:hypothetical protein
MKPKNKKAVPSLLNFRAEIRFSWHRTIHPEDALNALMAHAKQKIKSRRDGCTPAGLAQIMEDFWLASVANTPPGKWHDDVWATIQKRTQQSGRKFWERLMRATVGKRRRAREFDPVAELMLKNQRELERKDCGWERLPGLQDWHPTAVIAFMKFFFRTEPEAAKYIPNSAKSYNKKRRNNGLPPQPRGRRDYVVTDFRERADGQFEIETKD